MDVLLASIERFDQWLTRDSPSGIDTRDDSTCRISGITRESRAVTRFRAHNNRIFAGQLMHRVRFASELQVKENAVKPAKHLKMCLKRFRARSPY
jgi:hypothetical protein